MSNHSRTAGATAHGKDVVIEARGLTKVYNPGKESEVHVLKGIDLRILRGEFAAIMGPSGSGKTTLLDILGCLMKPTTGDVLIEGVCVRGLGENMLAGIRGKKIGFVFQQYNLIPTSTAAGNVELAMRLNGCPLSEARRRAQELLMLVGLETRMDHLPGQLSGGEQQRVAIARALSNRPSIILADEPTGNLDTTNGETILRLLRGLKKKGYTIIVITHDPKIKHYADRIIKLKDGEIV